MKVVHLLAVIPFASAARSTVNLGASIDAGSGEGVGDKSEVDMRMLDELINHASRMEAKTNSTDGAVATEAPWCCCQSTPLKQDCEEGQFYECIAFHRKPKCCMPMMQCEAKYWLYKSFHHSADKKLCTGQLDLSKPSKPSTDLRFFAEINENPNKDPTVLSRHYTIIIDQSASMSGESFVNVSEEMVLNLGDSPIGSFNPFNSGGQAMSLWNQSGIAAAFLAKHAVEVDPDGISLIFSGPPMSAWNNVKSTSALWLFRDQKQKGGSGLTYALNHALQPDTMGRAETVLVITDGAPNDQDGVERAIVSAARQLCRDADLAITFLQVGNASSASHFLEYLDDNLEKKHGIFDIVDTMSSTQMSGKTFLQIVESGIHD